MADYTGTTWVDDDGSGTVGTVGTAARMNNIESGIGDAATHHKTGLESAKPVATAANKNWRYYATDSKIEYQSDGVSWNALGMAPAGAAGGSLAGTYPNPSIASLNAGTAVAMRMGTLGSIVSGGNQTVFEHNRDPSTDFQLDGSKASYRFGASSLLDSFGIYRKAPLGNTTTQISTMTPLLLVSSAGDVTATASVYAGGGSNAQMGDLGSGLYGVRFGTDASLYRSGTGGALRSNSNLTLDQYLTVSGADGSGVAANLNAGMLLVQRATVGQYAHQVRIAGEANERFSALADGTLKWGQGGASVTDANFYRSAAATLKTDGSIQAVQQLYANMAGANQVTIGASGPGTIAPGIGFGTVIDASIWRDTSARTKHEGTVAADTAHVIRNKSVTGFSGFQYNDWNDNALAFIGIANNTVSASQYLRVNSGTLPLRLMYNSATRYENNATGMAWWGNTPIARPARPTTLTEVINLIANYGLSL